MKRDDMRRYIPDVATVLKESDPAAVAERRRKALEDPELQAAVAEMERERANSLNPEREAEEKSAPRTSAPSPWLKERGAETIDKSALPSATMGAAAAPSRSIEGAKREKGDAAAEKRARGGRWKLSPMLLALLVLGIVGPVLALAIGAAMRKRAPEVPATTGAPSATAAPPIAPTVSAPAAESGVAVEAPGASASVGVTAVSAPNPSAMRPKAGSTVAEPHDAAPPPQVSATPRASPPPPLPTIQKPHEKPPASEDFVFRKRDQ